MQVTPIVLTVGNHSENIAMSEDVFANSIAFESVVLYRMRKLREKHLTDAKPKKISVAVDSASEKR